jgi:hypothetical protein
MNDFMKVGFFQYNVIWRDRKANLSYIRSKIKDSTFDLLFRRQGYSYDYTHQSIGKSMFLYQLQSYWYGNVQW